MEAGADEFYVVIGWQSDQVRDFLKLLAKRLAIRITPLVNEDWKKENGLSVLKARDVLQEPFLLLMSDHLFDPEIVRTLTAHSLPDGEVALVVDNDIHNPLIDMDDVIRVKVENGNICDIGKGMTDFNGFDTGIFLCSSAIFDALEQNREKDGDTTLSGAIRVLAEDGRAKAISSNSLIIAGLQVPEDSRHADNTLEWLLRLEPDANDALQLAALAHDIDRAIGRIKIKRADFGNYDAFKAAHARNSAEILSPILTACGVERNIVKEACHLVQAHEVGGDPGSA